MKWAVVGPITVAGAEAGGAVAVTIHDIAINTPGVVTYGAYSRDVDPYEWWDDESGADAYPIEDGVVHFDEHTRLPTRPLIGCLAVVPGDGEVHAKLQGRYGGNLDCRELRAGATMILPVEHEGAGLYFGDCKALMGDSEIVGPPEVGAVVTASATAGRAAGIARMAADRDGGRADDDRLRKATRVGGAAGDAGAPELDRRRLRPAAREGGAAARDGRARAHRADQQHRLHRVLRRAARRARAVRALADQAASGDADHVVDDAVAHGEHAVVKVHTAARVVRDDLQVPADGGPLVEG